VEEKEERIWERFEWHYTPKHASWLNQVEVQTTLRLSDVNYFLEAVRNFKKYCPQYKFHTVYGVVAYLKSGSEARLFAERHRVCL